MITAVLPFGGALAGRKLTEQLTSAKLLPALTVLLADSLISLGTVVIQVPGGPLPPRANSGQRPGAAATRRRQASKASRHRPAGRLTEPRSLLKGHPCDASRPHFWPR